jgi:DNA-directed RNA polymerase subunit RPC12/RpoP
MTGSGDGKWKIKNLNDKNVTFVNGVAVESKVVSEKDKVELGRSHFLLQWSLFAIPKQEVVDIRPLKAIWEEYENDLMEITETERKKQNIQKFAGILSTAGILFMFAEGMGSLRFVLTGISLLISVILFLGGLSSDSSHVVKKNELEKEFRKRYTCPKCGHYIGNTPYDVLVQNNACPYCKAKFIK